MKVFYILLKYYLNNEEFLYFIENYLVLMFIFNFGIFFNGCKFIENGGFLFFLYDFVMF